MLLPLELKELCKTYGLSPSKNYGQNYLISDAPIRKMLEAGELSQEDTIIEIGPGFGVLTFALAPRVKKVLAFEIEKKLQPFWKEKEKEYSNIEVVWGNFLNMWKKENRNWKSETRENTEAIQYPVSSPPAGRAGFDFPISYKIVANLPYQITSEALRVMLEAEIKPERIIVMVQKEVAERICARPGDMSLLSVAVQYYGKPKIVAQVPKGNFWPVPKVDSAIVGIDLGTSAPQHLSTTTDKTNEFSDKEFFRVVKAGFTNKRKQLWRNISTSLKIPAEKVKMTLKEITGNEKVRAEELSVEEWKKIVIYLTNG